MPQADTPSSCMPPHLSGCGSQRLAEERQLVGEDRQLARLASCRTCPRRRSGRRGRAPARAAQPVSPTCFWPIMTWIWLDQPRNSVASCLPSLSRVLRIVRLAGPVPQVEEVHLAPDAPADDAARRRHAWPLVFGQVGRQRQDLLDRHVAIEPPAPGVEAEGLDPAELFQAAGTDVATDIGGFGHGRSSGLRCTSRCTSRKNGDCSGGRRTCQFQCGRAVSVSRVSFHANTPTPIENHPTL